MSTPWANHQRKWSQCKLCDLCNYRKKVVLCRGSLPCDILLVGEAPGASEDVLGIPFAGPAGKLLNHLIGLATEMAQTDCTLAFTNVVACIPLDGSREKASEPDKVSMEACKPRLIEMVDIAKPRALVAVGTLATKWLPKILPDAYGLEVHSILHPAAILRLDVSQKGLACQRVVVILADVMEGLKERA